MMTEQEAIGRLKRGDIGGLETLVKLYQVQAIRTAYLITHNRNVSEDLVQAAFLQAYDHITQFDTSRAFRPWFFRILINKALKVNTYGKRFTVSNEDTLSIPTLDTVLEVAETRDAVWTALEKLTPKQRASVVMRYYLDMSETEIAEELQCAPGTVKWNLHTARKRLYLLLHPFWLALSKLEK